MSSPISPNRSLPRHLASFARDLERGFTLLELLVVALITTLFFGMAFTFNENVRDYATRTTSEADARQATRLVLDRIGVDIRAAGADPSGRAFEDGVDVFAETTETSLRLRMDRPQDVNGDGDTYDVVDSNDDGDTHDTDENENGDGFLDDAWEDVTYTYDADTQTFYLVDNVTGTTLTLAERVIANPDGNPVFQYEMQGSTVVAVTVEITTQSSTVDEVQGEPQTSTGRITARPRLALSTAIDSVSGSD